MTGANKPTVTRTAREASCKSQMEAGSRPVGREHYGRNTDRNIGRRTRSNRIGGFAMSADIIQFVPRPNPNRDQRTLEQQAIEIFNVALIGPGGIDDLLTEDTSPSEMNPDPA